MKRIPLTQGQVALVDDADFEAVSQFKWHAMFIRGVFYAARKIPGGPGKQITFYLHNAILPTNKQVDHRDGDGLNNQRANLRVATRKQNAGNQRRAKNNTSGLKGVSFHRRDQVWAAHIRVDGKALHLGNFKTREAAHAAYSAAAIKYFGEFARFSF